MRRKFKQDGLRFKDRLAELEMSQTGLAQMLEVNLTTVNRWASGRRPVRPSVWLILDHLKKSKPNGEKMRKS
jgi:DNA-binding transcriptional regulator YiaG